MGTVCKALCACVVRLRCSPRVRCTACVHTAWHGAGVEGWPCEHLGTVHGGYHPSLNWGGSLAPLAPFSWSSLVAVGAATGCSVLRGWRQRGACKGSLASTPPAHGVQQAQDIRTCINICLYVCFCNMFFLVAASGAHFPLAPRDPCHGCARAGVNPHMRAFNFARLKIDRPCLEVWPGTFCLKFVHFGPEN